MKVKPKTDGSQKMDGSDVQPSRKTDESVYEFYLFEMFNRSTYTQWETGCSRALKTACETLITRSNQGKKYSWEEAVSRVVHDLRGCQCKE